jgi:AcrR family transcriptional regulator
MSIEADRKAPRTDTRERIVAVAAHLFATRGFAGTSVRDIADELGVTKAALYYHFESKEVLLRSIVAQAFTAVEEVMAEQRDLTTPGERQRFVRDVISAMSSCDNDVVAVLKDPTLAPLVHDSKATSGITHELATRLAMGLTGTSDRDRIRPQDLMRAIAAVGAGYEAINNWHVAYPECTRFFDADVEAITGFVCDVLEAQPR